MDSTTPSKIQRAKRMTADFHLAFQMSYIKTNSNFDLLMYLATGKENTQSESVSRAL